MMTHDSGSHPRHGARRRARGCGWISFTLALAACAADAPQAEETSVPGPQPICIATHYTHDACVFGDIASENHNAYARRHGYTAFTFKGRFSGDRFRDDAPAPPWFRPLHVYGEGLYWQKIHVVQTLLERVAPGTSEPLCQWVMWMDDDAIFTNFTHRIEATLAAHPDKDVIIAREHHASTVNSGAFFVKNSPQGRDFIASVADMYDAYKNATFPEQQAIQDHIFQLAGPTAGYVPLEDVHHRLLPHVAVTEQRAFNSFLPSWQRCDFVLHAAGVPHQARAQVLIEHMRTIPSCEE